MLYLSSNISNSKYDIKIQASSMVKGIKKDTHSHLRNPAMDEKLQKVVLQNLVVPKSNAKCMKTQKEPTSHAKQVFHCLEFHISIESSKKYSQVVSLPCF